MNKRPKPVNRHYDVGRYVLINQGEIVWESPSFYSDEPLRHVNDISRDVRKAFPNGQLYLKVNTDASKSS